MTTGTEPTLTERRCVLHPEMPCPAKSEDDKCICTPPADYDPTAWCIGCGAMSPDRCDCGPIAENN